MASWRVQDECVASLSLGLRSCLGKGLAYTELTLMLASLLFASDFKFVDEKLAQESATLL